MHCIDDGGEYIVMIRTKLGTPYYMSPEICKNKSYNNKSDIWALGCVLYELATLNHAFQSRTMQGLVLRILKGTYPPIPPYVHITCIFIISEYSQEMDDLINSMLQREAEERPSINKILKLPFIKDRIVVFLEEGLIRDEFSHTVIHGHSDHGVLPHEVVPPGAKPPSRPSSAGQRKTPSPAQLHLLVKPYVSVMSNMSLSDRHQHQDRNHLKRSGGVN